ncbi:hypothetical protein B0T24DRAFT_121455 [Lasiosphaeria ovina]|uniref:Uncharacterized protein n=1 Tax=Lasiosphaeria ovina TaxID=92902 RepID=A0AAE0JSM4_9PEZI|nr:hypothetical protein B0T24DRAFT_121455 [Lasiosphaeria ovina]
MESFVVFHITAIIGSFNKSTTSISVSVKEKRQPLYATSGSQARLRWLRSAESVPWLFFPGVVIGSNLYLWIYVGQCPLKILKIGAAGPSPGRSLEPRYWSELAEITPDDLWFLFQVVTCARAKIIITRQAFLLDDVLEARAQFLVPNCFWDFTVGFEAPWSLKYSTDRSRGSLGTQFSKSDK